MNVRSKDELAAFVSAVCRCENCHDEGCRAEHMPSHRDIYQVIKDSHAFAWGYTDGLGNLDIDVVGAIDLLTRDMVMTMY